MTGENQHPKADGDVLYSSEINKTFYCCYGQNTFGDGSDGAGSGDITISTPVKHYTSLTIANGNTLTFSTYGKFVIYVQGDMTINGAITLTAPVNATPNIMDCSDATAGSGATAGAGGVSKTGALMCWLPPMQVKFPAEGGDATAGQNGGTGGTAGTVGVSKAIMVYFFVGGTVTFGSTAVVNGNGTNGGNGGNASAEGQGGGGGGGGGAAGAVVIFNRKDHTVTAGATITMTGGNGGNGGTGQSAGGTTATSGGGGGGAGGYCGSGGNGGNGASIYQGAPSGGGGGGGTGGLWIALCGGTYTENGTITVTGGTGGTGQNNGADGAAGIKYAKSLTYTIT